ncbi:acyl-CoA synthetase [compost metagenome]
MVALAIHGAAASLPADEQVRTFIAERLAAYKVPTQVYRVDQPLPRNATGKVLKAELKARLVSA